MNLQHAGGVGRCARSAGNDFSLLIQRGAERRKARDFAMPLLIDWLRSSNNDAISIRSRKKEAPDPCGSGA
jgi:hypothetical protein